ncbi:hypothetical protein Hte_010195 [Hypoxylon texense]
MPRPRPQAISHRGYKAAFPENTTAAFRGAVDVGAHAIETDLHFVQGRRRRTVACRTRRLKRCFGVPRKVAECDWDYLSTLRTLREPKQPIPRLVDLLEYLNEPGQESIWLFLDVKTDDDSAHLLTCVAKAIASVPSARPWNQRIISTTTTTTTSTLASGLVYATFPGLPRRAHRVLAPRSPRRRSRSRPCTFSLLDASFATPRPRRAAVPAAGPQAGRARLVFSWSDSEDRGYMALSIRDEVDGSMTDDPRRFLALCSRWSEERGGGGGASRPTARLAVLWAVYNVLVWITEICLRLTKGSPRARAERELGKLAR